MYNIFTVEVKIPSQQGAAQFGGITHFCPSWGWTSYLTKLIHSYMGINFY
jgi:hypothetical protein